ncbi:cysteine proteinase inhibitor 5 [Cajanus cajan]|uniref:cysteine proteinase inhibitor 5 n=1 Tax=Cajanus cajan TaxID=3821 RepID=UPI00098DB6E1|nr:cysteine proteinase inhibitor 5 [Cajanus cajan]
MGYHHSLLFLSLLLVVAAARRPEAVVGGWSPIKDLKEPHVAEIANYAVGEYDKRSGAKLKLVKVVKGETQVVAGTNYRLVLAAKDGSATANYEAVVYEKPWLRFRNLTSFVPLHS